MPFQAACTTDEKVPAAISYTTASGRPASVDGITNVDLVSGDGAFERVGDHDGFFRSGDVAGDSVFSIRADVDLGSGVVEISETVTLTATSAQAAVFGVSFGAPVPK